LPQDGLAEVALVGRSNVGKSSLINALTRQKVARTSAAPGKTRLANVYRVEYGSANPFYLVDLPGYGYARAPRHSQGGPSRARGSEASGFEDLAIGVLERRPGVLLLVDARHPALESDLAAWNWLRDTGVDTAVVATKIDKLTRAERLRALKANDAAFEHPVLPVSAVTGEGLDELWTLISRIQSNPSSRRPLPRRPSSPPSPPRPHRKN
jgi:GTP-binding protein